jgi:sulfite reductase beta subunit-like hemoprotein
VTALGADQPRDLSPLEMAQNCAAAVGRYAEFTDREPIQAHVMHAGEQGHQAANLAGNMALVSIAEDLHRIAAVLCKFDAWADSNDDAIANARATREHMRNWAAGEETHPGEAP